MTSGAVQWMTAGRGVVHSEMPGPVDTRGLQLWVNLKKKDKMVQRILKKDEENYIAYQAKDFHTEAG